MNFREVFQTAIVSSFLCVKIIWSSKFNAAECSHNYTTGLHTAYCEIEWSPSDSRWGQKYPILPNNLPATLQVIQITGKVGRYNGLFLWPTSFEQYPQIIRIINKDSFQIKLTNLPAKKAEMQENFTKIFSRLKWLEHLEYSNSYLEDWLVVHLPSQLKYLNFDGNHYQTLDVHWAIDLEELSVQRNNLVNIPKISPVPSPPMLRKLRLNGNPLQEMTVLDIAPLCNLALLELDFPNFTLYLQKSGYCKCITLKKWAHETELQGLEKVNCFVSTVQPNCSEEKLREARRIRNHCPLLKQGETSATIIRVLKYTFMFILLAILLAATILYIIRHFHLKEYWAAHHLRKSQVDPIKMTEEEEEMEEESTNSSDFGEDLIIAE